MSEALDQLLKELETLSQEEVIKRVEEEMAAIKASIEEARRQARNN